MISSSQQTFDNIGDPGGNRTRDNLIKSHSLYICAQRLAKLKSVKPQLSGQYVAGELSNHGNAKP
jgi:hypothetical protein